MPKNAWKVISLLSAALGVVALLILVLAGLNTAQTGRGYNELIIWVAATVILLPLSYFTNRMGKQAR